MVLVLEVLVNIKKIYWQTIYKFYCKLIQNEEKRIKIEHTNAHFKQYKIISIRYDKYISHYINFIYLACINIIITAYP